MKYHADRIERMNEVVFMVRGYRPNGTTYDIEEFSGYDAAIQASQFCKRLETLDNIRKAAQIKS